MMREIFITLVPGTMWMVLLCMFFLGIGLAIESREDIFLYGIASLLNFYSWDYQRRRANGENMP